MIIGIDGSSILPRRTGVGHYTFHLLKALAELDPSDEVRVFLNSLRHPFPEDAAFLKRRPFRARRLRLPGPWLVTAWRRFGTPPIDWLAGRCDVFHSPATYAPPQRHGARVTTVHDLYFLRRPENCHALGGAFFHEYLPRVAPSLDRIIAVSRSTARDCEELLGVDPARVRVVYEGVDPAFRPVTAPEALATTRRRYSLPESYLLTVATLEPRKNLEGLLRAYRIVADRRPETPPLALVGCEGWQTERIYALSHELGLDERVVFTGYVRFDDLPAVYSQARAFALVSHYEGFGLPLLEAMACATPCVASSTTSLGEVAGDAATLVNPSDDEAVADGLERVLTDETTRTRLMKAGPRRAATFTWRRCAEETLDVYREAAG